MQSGNVKKQGWIYGYQLDIDALSNDMIRHLGIFAFPPEVRRSDRPSSKKTNFFVWSPSQSFLDTAANAAIITDGGGKDDATPSLTTMRKSKQPMGYEHLPCGYGYGWSTGYEVLEWNWLCGERFRMICYLLKLCERHVSDC